MRIGSDDDTSRAHSAPHFRRRRRNVSRARPRLGIAAQDADLDGVELAVFTVCRPVGEDVAAVEVAGHQLQTRRRRPRGKEGAAGFLDDAPEHGLRLVDSIRRCLRSLGSQT